MATIVINGVTYNLKRIDETTYKADISDTDLIPFAGPDGKFYHQTFTDLQTNLGGLVSGFKGAIAIADTPTEDGIYIPSESGTYIHADGIVVDLTEGLTLIVKTGSDFSKILIPIDLSGYTTTEQFDELSAKVDGETETAGASDDLTTYSTVNIATYTRIGLLNPIPFAGKINSISGNFTTAGDFQISIWRHVGSLWQCTGIKSLTAATTGVNIFNFPGDFDEFPVTEDDYVGVTLLTGGALVAYKVKTSGTNSFNSLGNPAILGETHNYGSDSNNEFAISIEVKGDSLESQINVLKEQSESAIKESDLTIRTSTNIAKYDYKKDGLLINSTGAKQLISGWRSYRIPGADGDIITFGRFSINTAGYYAFYNNTEVNGAAGSTGLIGTAVSFNTASLPKTITFPSGAVCVYVTTKRPENTDADSEQLTINEGSELLDYELPGEVITQIKGHYIGGGGTGPVPPPPNLAYLKPLEYTSNRKATFTFIFDDLNDTDDLVYNVFKEYGFRPSFALIGNRVNGTSIVPYIEYWKDGCSILNHTWSHQTMGTSSTLTDNQANTEIVNGKAIIELYNIRTSGFVTPYSVLKSDFLPLVQRVHGYAFTTTGDLILNQTIAPTTLSRTSMESNDLSACQEIIDTAIDNKQLVVFYAHKVPNAEGTFLEADLRAILEYVKTKYDNYECLVLNSDDAIRTYYSETWQEKFGA